MPFHDLDEHAVAEILACCDIRDVLSFTRVNRQCRILALSKQLWIHLIRDLEYRGLRDSDPKEHLHTLTTSQLQDLVKHTVLGPRTWSPTCPTPPKIKRDVVVRFDKPLARRTSVVLLPGGKYIFLCERWDDLKIVQVATGRRVWIPPSRVASWSWDMMDGGDRIVVDFQTYGSSYEKAIHIVEIDLETGDCREALCLPILDDVEHPSLHGDFFSICIRTEFAFEASDLLLIINWRTKTYALLEFPPSFTMRAVLLPDHVVVTYTETQPTNRRRLLIYSLTSPSLLWRPIHAMPRLLDITSPQHPTPLITHALPESPNQVQILSLRVYKDPLQHNASVITIYNSAREELLPNMGFFSRLFSAFGWHNTDALPYVRYRSALQSFHFSVNPECRFRVLAPVRAAHFSTPPALTLAGYGVDMPLYGSLVFMDARCEREGVCVVDSEPTREVLQRRTVDSGHVSPLGVYSSAVVDVGEFEVRVSYFV
ncbi:hypothetical protein FB45DRAFT_921061 [Roridomyces roridus]|uniref:F-box domain-containing protein n=1 Tax=Roridomyces roridus TaxID=1738132 RepID=A0AAD7BQ43_9AGAR|nr:hypothetical protein FB45DRAFT_921061 [Roridomyces roridus]